MDCDYCGLATGIPATWEITSGDWPGDGMTRYVCDAHREAAERHVGATGPVRLHQTNRTYETPRSAA